MSNKNGFNISIKLDNKMSTQLQTVEITMKYSTSVILSLEKFPICPDSPEFDILGLDAPNGDIYTWYPDQSASIQSKDGTYRYFHKKPIIKEALSNIRRNQSTYTRFFQDGSVESRFYIPGHSGYNQYYWWGPRTEGEPVVGTTYEVCLYCVGKNCYERCQSDKKQQ
jgi:hypothetical protein